MNTISLTVPRAAPGRKGTVTRKLRQRGGACPDRSANVTARPSCSAVPLGQSSHQVRQDGLTRGAVTSTAPAEVRTSVYDAKPTASPGSPGTPAPSADAEQAARAPPTTTCRCPCAEPNRPDGAGRRSRGATPVDPRPWTPVVRCRCRCRCRCRTVRLPGSAAPRRILVPDTSDWTCSWRFGACVVKAQSPVPLDRPAIELFPLGRWSPTRPRRSQ